LLSRDALHLAQLLNAKVIYISHQSEILKIIFIEPNQQMMLLKTELLIVL